MNTIAASQTLLRHSTGLIWILLSLPLLLLALQVKQQRLSDGGYRILARNLQRMEELNIHWWERAALFLPDVLLVLLIWLLLTVVFRGGKAFVMASAGLSTFLIVFLYVNMQVFGSVGRYLTPAMIADALQWARDHPHQMKAYVAPGSLAKIVLLLLGNLALHAMAWRLHERYRANSRALLLRAKTALLLVVGCFLVVSHALASTIMSSRYSHSTLHQTVVQFLIAPPGATQAFEKVKSLGELARIPVARELSPTCGMDSGLRGKARDHDIVIFSMETMPASVVDLTNRLHEYPTMARLATNALIAHRHHSPFPYTSYALYSAFTGLYPTQRLETTYQTTGSGEAEPVELPGFLRALAREGYVVEAFFPTQHSFELDRFIYRSLGAVKEHFADGAQGNVPSAPAGMPPMWAKDTAALRALQTTIATHAANNQRFAAMFLPQIGHAPWASLGEGNSTVLERGRAIARLQDQWLGAIMDTLEQTGRRDKTLVIVQTDHGVRTRNEDPSFPGGFIDAYSFHVPLLIHSREVFKERRDVHHITSHVDLPSTIGDLLALELQGHSQGMPVHCPSPPKRIVPLFADWYLGADGFHAEDEFCMVNNITDTVYCNRQLEFNDGHVVLDQAKREQVATTLHTIKSYQERLTELSVPGIRSGQGPVAGR